MSPKPTTSTTAGGGSGAGGPSPCGACKFLRRKCVAGCVFAPYFDTEQFAGQFPAVHKVFGASNVSKLLLHIPVNRRREAVVTVCYEAQARLRDPVYGCVAQIFSLQRQVANLQAELSYFQAHLSTIESMRPPPPPPPPPPELLAPPPESSITNIPIASCIPATYGLSSLFDPTVQLSSWTMQPPTNRQEGGGNAIAAPEDMPLPSSDGGGRGVAGGGDLQEVARELFHGLSSVSSVVVPCTFATI